MQSLLPGIVDLFVFSFGMFFCLIFAVAHLGQQSVGLDNPNLRHRGVPSLHGRLHTELLFSLIIPIIIIRNYYIESNQVGSIKGVNYY